MWDGSAAAQESERDRNRDTWQRPGEVFDALGVKPGDRVADIGCGSGYFVFGLAARVGAEGRVYGVDIDPAALDKVRQRKEREQLVQVEAILGESADPRLPGDLDSVLIVDTYHEFREYDQTMRAVFRALKPGGRLVIIDGEGPAGRPRTEYHRLHVIPPEIVREEVAKEGFIFKDNRPGFYDAEYGKKMYFLVFEKPSQTSSPSLIAEDGHTVRETRGNGVQSFQIESAILKEKRRIYIALPASYAQSAPERRYPVTIVLDGEANVPPAAAVSHELSRNGQIPESVIVAIPNTDPFRGRLRDLTPPQKLLRNVVEDLLMEGRGAAAREIYNVLAAGYGAPTDGARLLEQIAEVERRPPPAETVEGLLSTPFPTPEEARNYIGDWVGDVWMNPEEPRRGNLTLQLRVVDGAVVGELIDVAIPDPYRTRRLEYLRVTADGMTYGFMNGMRPRGVLLYEGRLEGDALAGKIRIGGVDFRPPQGMGGRSVNFLLKRVRR